MEKQKIKSASSIEMRIVLELTEKEARFLRLITKWGSKMYIEWFQKNCSKYDMKEVKSGCESLFETINQELPKHLEKIDKARQLLSTPIKTTP